MGIIKAVVSAGQDKVGDKLLAFSIYVHVPFCVSKCHYCAFYSEPIGVDAHATEKTAPTEDENVPSKPFMARSLACTRTSSIVLRTSYFEGLDREIKLRRQDAFPRASSLFIGGGTPTVLSEDELGCLLKMLRRSFEIEPGAEISVEGNPGTLTEEKLAILAENRVNRFSLGVQSFDDRIMRQIGRRHTAAQARRGIVLLRDAGVRNLNLDLMFGLPGQTIAGWQACVEEALRFKPEHLSLYGLTLETGTVLARQAAEGLLTGDVMLPDEDRQADMYEWAVDRLSEAGYRHYETSNFALSGYECRHNLNYWQSGDYLGLGPGAVSCRDGVRWRNVENIRQYRQMLEKGNEPVAERETLSVRDRMTERLMLGLRTADGVDLAMFEADFGHPVDKIFAAVLAKHIASGVLSRANGYLKLHPAYAFVANAILRDFV